jgi:hypothetical protein
MTWPLVGDFRTRMCGGLGDPQLTLWSMRWLRDAVGSLHNPFFTPRLYYPQGTTLVFHTFDLPSAVLVLPLWGWVSEVAIYNTAVVLAFALTVYGMARLARELTGDELCGGLAGLLFAGCPYHYAHLQGQLHLVSMGWLPLYAVHLVRILDDRGGDRDAVLAGVFLALAALASWYHFVFAAVITLVLVPFSDWRCRGSAGAGRLLRRSAVVALVWAPLAGPLLVAMIVTRQHEAILGAHDAASFSADASSFFDPTALRLLLDGEHATFVGFTVAVLAVLGAALDRRARRFVAVGVVGGVLTLGPSLIWRGETLGWETPYGYLERFVPGLRFSGVPVRFGYVMYFGLVVAAAFGLARIRKARGSSALGLVLVVAVTGVALWEWRAGPVVTSRCPEPAPMRAWARDEGPWAVLDVSGGWSQMWHATLHRKPIVGGYVGRVPKRLEEWIVHQPVLRAIMFPDGEIALSRVETEVPAVPSAMPGDDLVGDRYSAEWNGSLIVPTSGLYTFEMATPANAVLTIANVDAVRAFSGAGGVHKQRSGQLRLRVGARVFRLRIFDAPPAGRIALRWKPPGDDWEPIPAGALRTAAGGAGLDVEYRQHIPALSGLGRHEGREALRRLAIRYVVTGDQPGACIEQELELPETYRGEGVRIFEVPSRADDGEARSG